MGTQQDVSRILDDLLGGDERAADRLLPLVYDELRRLASRYLYHESPDQTLQPTALVHEAFLKLVNQEDAQWNSRAHFYRVAALAMRRILVNHARDKKRLKRGGGSKKLSMDDVDVAAQSSGVDLVALDEAMTRLAQFDERKEQIAQLRYFGGLTVEETGKVLDISPAQVKREWTSAKAYLLRELMNGADS